MAKTDVPVVVTTKHRGVFFGYVARDTKLDVDTLRIEQARMCVYWSSDVKGVLGLASCGPSALSRVGPAVPAVTVRDITAVMEAPRDAATAWEKGPWNK